MSDVAPFWQTGSHEVLDSTVITSIQTPPPFPIIILHETDGRKYFEALIRLAGAGKISPIKFYEFQILRLFLSSTLRHGRPFFQSLRQALRNFSFRLSVPFVRGHIIVLGMAPWDIRLLWYRQLARRNKIIYHTSWTQWADNAVPRRYGLINSLLASAWLRFLKHRNVTIVAVTSASAKAFEVRTGVHASIISHAISDQFFDAPAEIERKPFGLLFIGQLIAQKGVKLLPAIMKGVDPSLQLGIIGDGPLRDDVEKMAAEALRTRYYGSISNRQQLADIVSRHHVLIVPSVRTDRWEELFGMVIPEAMAAGLVVIASDHAGPRSVISDRCDGFIVEEGDVNAIIGRITELYDSETLWRTMSDAARLKAKSYSLEMVGLKWQKKILSVSTEMKLL